MSTTPTLKKVSLTVTMRVNDAHASVGFEAPPRAGRRVADDEDGVGYVQPCAGLLGDLDEVAALLDADEGQLRRHIGGDEHELADARPNVEHLPCARFTQQVGRPPGDVDRGPKPT